MISIKDATVVKGGKTLFKGFTFEVRKGEHWLIQGENGSGKTTLLQLLSGSIAPFEGTVTHSFISAGDWDERYAQRQQMIHFVPTHWIQSFLSGFHDLFYQQRYYSVEDTELPKVADVFGDDIDSLRSLAFSDNFDIDRLLNLHITRLSNGQLKKVIILRQLARNIPKLLILDYPFDGLDAESRRDLSNFIDDIAIRFEIQIILTDHGHSHPSVINRRLVLRNFAIAESGKVDGARCENAASVAAPRVEQLPDAIPVVEMRNLNITYGNSKIISNLSWRVNKGERWALTGKNGSGKTTLFSLIYADHPMAYSQKVFLFGKRRGSGESIWDIKNRINYLGPEQIHFLDERTRALSGRQFISSRQGQHEQLAELIAFFDASPYIDTPLRTLSSGHLQMVMLMNMFLDDREVLLLDEPFQFLDPVNHERVTTYLNHYLNDNITLILITHDERDVARWTSHRKIL